MTGVNGPSEASGRLGFWEQLKGLKLRDELSWLIFGDFNEILFHFDKWGGRDYPKK